MIPEKNVIMVLETWWDDNGTSSLIRHAHEEAIYVNCMNHRLNLSVADTCSVALVSTMMNVVRALSEYFNDSTKPQQCLIAKVRELQPNNNHRALIGVCRTGWISRIRGMDRIVEVPSIISLLEDNTLNNDIQVDENRTIIFQSLRIALSVSRTIFFYIYYLCECVVMYL